MPYYELFHKVKPLIFEVDIKKYVSCNWKVKYNNY